MNWDNLRFVLMVANKGSIAAAARELDVNRTTVLRRIDQFQQSLNCRLFERGDSGYVLTPEAEKIVEAAREVENTLYDMSRRVVGRELRLEGSLRVTTTDTFMLAQLAPHLAAFRRRYPRIVVDVLLTNTLLDLHHRDADVAIRPTLEAEPGLVCRRVGDVEFGFYATSDLAAELGDKDPLDADWIGFADGLAATPVGRWFATQVDPQRIVMRCDSFVAMRVAAEQGIGLAMLPCVLGEVPERLQRIGDPIEEVKAGLWLMAHPDLVRSARVNAFIEYFDSALRDSG